MRPVRPEQGDTTLLSGKRLGANAEQLDDAAFMDANIGL